MERLNLRRNPFGELTPEEQLALAVVDLQDWPAWLLAGPRRALLLVGPPGRGKTTHLRALAAEVPAAVWARPEEQDGACDPAPPGALLCLDDAQRLAPRALLRVTDPARGLALCDHGERGRALRGAGWEVRACRLEAPGSAQLCELVRRRIEAVRRAAGPVPHLGEPAAAALLEACAGDVRAVLDRLYWRVQEATHAGALA